MAEKPDDTDNVRRTGDTDNVRAPLHETLPLVEILAIKLGFLPEKDFRIGPQPVQDFMVLDSNLRTYCRLKQDPNPHRNWLDLQVLLFASKLQLFSVWGEVLESAAQRYEKIALDVQYLICEGEAVIKDYLLAEQSRTRQTKRLSPNQIRTILRRD